ncbi:DUF4333 domain-containing protein [Lentzea sp. NPDC058436]|uniref:DUF4333 domain-containing protein n=1 Tax=Lentzea sp. NPDC058436 TaxID=3346499 RepID=UPI00364C472D
MTSGSLSKECPQQSRELAQMSTQALRTASRVPQETSRARPDTRMRCNSLICDLDLTQVTSRLTSLAVISLLAAGCTSPTPGTPVPAPSTVTVRGAAVVPRSTVGVVPTVTVTRTAPRERHVFMTDAVEYGVGQVLTDEYKISDVGRVTCPESQDVEPGRTFICAVAVGGVDRSVKITVKTADGEYEVGQPG